MGTTNSRSLRCAKASRFAPDDSWYEDVTYTEEPADIKQNRPYSGGVLLRDGRVVFVPHNATTIGIFNPATNAYSTIANQVGESFAQTGLPDTYPGALYYGGVLLRDGRVVFVPFCAKTIGIFDPTTNTYSTVPGAPGGAAYHDGVLLADGRVLFVPFCATTFGIFDPKTNEYSTIAGVRAPGKAAYNGGVLLQDGRVMLLPWYSKRIGIFDPKTNKYSLGAKSALDKYAYRGSVLLADGRVLFVPHSTTGIGMFDPKTNTHSVVAEIPSKEFMYFGGVLLPDGRVLFVPYCAATIGIFDPATNKYSAVANTLGDATYQGGVLLADGRVLFVPWTWTVSHIGILTLPDVKARRRAHLRTEAVKQELIAAAWHPKRMTDWCLDTDERRELAEMGVD